MSWLRNAFAVDRPGPAEPTAVQRRVVERVCVEIVKRRLTTPALIFLETSRPLNYLGAQALHFLRPIATVILDGEGYGCFTEFLEQRGSVDYFCNRIQELEIEADRKQAKRPRPATGHSTDGQS